MQGTADQPRAIARAARRVGFRDPVAPSYWMHMGLDVARGPDQTIWYVVFGNGEFRP